MSDKTPTKPIETQQLTVQRPQGLALMDPTDQTEHGLALLEERVRVAKRQTTILMQLVSPNQVVVMSGADGAESVYFTGGAADRILRMGFGMRFGDWTWEIHRGSEETTCVAKADLLQQNGEIYERRTGMRAMGGFVRNERDLVKGAIENAKHLAVHDILGLRFLKRADYKELGLDLDKLERRVEYQSHDKQSSEFVAPFGRSKGKPLSELTDDDLKWLAETIKKNVDDPSKSKWRAKNEALYQACREEWKRRHAKPEEPEEPLVDPPDEELVPEDSSEWDEVGPPPMERDREPGEDG